MLSGAAKQSRGADSQAGDGCIVASARSFIDAHRWCGSPGRIGRTCRGDGAIGSGSTGATGVTMLFPFAR